MLMLVLSGVKALKKFSLVNRARLQKSTTQKFVFMQLPTLTLNSKSKSAEVKNLLKLLKLLLERLAS